MCFCSQACNTRDEWNVPFGSSNLRKVLRELRLDCYSPVKAVTDWLTQRQRADSHKGKLPLSFPAELQSSAAKLPYRTESCKSVHAASWNFEIVVWAEPSCMCAGSLWRSHSLWLCSFYDLVPVSCATVIFPLLVCAVNVFLLVLGRTSGPCDHRTASYRLLWRP